MKEQASATCVRGLVQTFEGELSGESAARFVSDVVLGMPSGAADWLAENAEDRTTLGQCARDLMQASKGRLSYSQAAVCVSLHHLRTALELAAEEAHSDDVPVGASAESDAGSTPGSDLGSGAGEAAPTEGFSEKTTRPGRNEVPAAGATAVKAEDAIATAGAGAAASTAEDAEATASDGTADDGGEAGQNAASRIRVRLPDEVETGQDAPIARSGLPDVTRIDELREWHVPAVQIVSALDRENVPAREIFGALCRPTLYLRLDETVKAMSEAGLGLGDIFRAVMTKLPEHRRSRGLAALMSAGYPADRVNQKLNRHFAAEIDTLLRQPLEAASTDEGVPALVGSIQAMPGASKDIVRRVVSQLPEGRRGVGVAALRRAQFSVEDVENGLVEHFTEEARRLMDYATGRVGRDRL